MESVTLGQIGLGITFIVGLITGIAYLKKWLENWISGSLKGNFDEIKKDIQNQKKQIDDVYLENTKNFLVRVIADVKRGTPKDEVEMLRFWDAYEHYIQKGGNTYIKKEVETLRAEGKL